MSIPLQQQENFNSDEVIISSFTDGHNDFTFKIIILGDSSVGKSSLLNRCVFDKFQEYYTSTIGFDLLTLNSQYKDCKMKLQLWDTCGQENYRSLVTSFFKEASLAILVYSIDNYSSFENLEYWIKDLKLHTKPDVKVIVIGNKSDLILDRRVSIENLKKFSKIHNVLFYDEVSAKAGINTKKIFQYATKILYDDYNLNNRGNIKSKLNSQDTYDHGFSLKNSNKNINIIDLDIKDNKGCC